MRLIRHAEVVEVPGAAASDRNNLTVALGVVVGRARPTPLPAPAGERPARHGVVPASELQHRAEPCCEGAEIGGPLVVRGEYEPPPVVLRVVVPVTGEVGLDDRSGARVRAWPFCVS